MKEEGSIGLYIKDSIEYKVRHDVKKVEESLGHLRIKPSVALKPYKEVIETYNLKQNIIIPTRKGTNTLIKSLQTYKRINWSPQTFYYVQPLVTMMHRFNIKDYIDDFKTLQLSLVFSFKELKKH